MKLIGVVHLLPLPGSPRAVPMADVVERALNDVRTMVAGGLNAILVENFGDAPFFPGRVPVHVAAAMAAVAVRVRDEPGVHELGLNVLRNDAVAAMGVAAAIGADFVRVNVLSGAAWTDQGLVQGEAHEVLRTRAALRSNAQIAADVLVKHAVPAGSADAAEVARDLVERGGADVLVVTGSRTGQAADRARLRLVRGAAPHVPLWVGSGVVPDQVAALRDEVDAALVGTWLHRDGRLDAPVDVARVRALVSARERG